MAETLVFEPPLPGSWSRVGHRALALVTHESAHAVIAAWLGLEIVEVRVDRPEPGVGGFVRGSPDLDRLQGYLMATLAGPIAAPLSTSITWPPDPDGYGDERILAVLVAAISDRNGSFQETDWDESVTDTRRLLDVPAVRRARSALGDVLLERGALPGAEVLRIVSKALTEPPQTRWVVRSR